MEKVAILNTTPDTPLPSGNAGPYGITPSLTKPAPDKVSPGSRHQIADQIREAADATGVPFEFLLAQASQESNLNPEARSSNSTATGLFQFTAGTWLQMVYNHGSKHGLDEYARLITRNSQGELTVRDPAQLRDILDLRKDPKTSALMAGEYARENRQALESRLGRAVSTHDLYLAHFLGAAGASRLLGSAPDGTAADHLPDAAAANPTIFQDSNQEPRSVASLVRTVRHRFDRAHSTIMPVAQELRPALDLASLKPEPRPSEESADERLLASLQAVRQWLTFVEETALPALDAAVASNSREFAALRPTARPEPEPEPSLFNPYDVEERLIVEAPPVPPAAAPVVAETETEAEPVITAAVAPITEFTETSPAPVIDEPVVVTAMETVTPPDEPVAPDPVLTTLVTLPPIQTAAITTATVTSAPPVRTEAAAVRLSFAMPPPLVSPIATATLAEATVDLPPIPASATPLIAPSTEAIVPALHPFDSPVRGGEKLVAPMPPPLPTAVANTRQPETPPITPVSFRSG